MPDQQPNEGSLFLTNDQTAGITVAPPTAPRIVIYSEDNRTPLVTINPNGTLEYGPGYGPDEAARRFWEAMRIRMPARCSNCGHVAGGGA